MIQKDSYTVLRFKMSTVIPVKLDVDRWSEGIGNLSFAGCGFLGIYHVGVASCFKEYAPHLYADRICGASAGALVACALITGCCLGECTSFTLKLALQARSRALGPLSPSFELVKNLRQALDKFLPENAHEIANGRLFISLTRLSDKQNVLVSRFSDKNDLIDALICSSFVPLYSGIWPPKYRGVRYVDGALSDNIPLLDKNTITVSPFAGESDICPDDRSCNLHHINLAGTSIQLTAGNLYRISVAFFPPNPEILSNMCRQGFDDALRFLKKNRLISCTQHISIQSAIISSSPLKFGLFDEVRSGEVTEAEWEEEKEEEDDESSCCDECEKRERLALHDSPPLLVQTALQAACDEVNKGFLAKIYKSKVYRVVSLLATPYVLPFELTYHLVRKFCCWAPYIPDDMQWFISELYKLVVDLLSTCESSIKNQSMWELNHLALTMGVYFGVRLEATTRNRKISHRKRSSVGRPPFINRGQLEYHQHQHQAPPGEPQRIVLSSNRKLSNDASSDSDMNTLNVNFGININYVQSPLQCARHARGWLGEQEQLRKELLPVSAGNQSTPGHEISPIACSDMCNTTYDTFDNCLNISNQMDSILSYYYLEENDPTTVKVVEIFPRHPIQSCKPENQKSWM